MDSGEYFLRRKLLKESIRRFFRRLRFRKGFRSGVERIFKKEGEVLVFFILEVVIFLVSRFVEENRVDESVLSMVRCLYFVDIFVRDGKVFIINLVYILLYYIKVIVF